MSNADPESAVWMWEYRVEPAPAMSPEFSPSTTLKPWPGTNHSSVLTTQKTKTPCSPNVLQGLFSPLTPEFTYIFTHLLHSQKIAYSWSNNAEPVPTSSAIRWAELYFLNKVWISSKFVLPCILHYLKKENNHMTISKLR